MSPTRLAARSVIGSPPSNCVLFQFSLESESISFAICSIDASERVTDNNIAGHSVRAGMATQEALNGSSERAIARTTRHRSRRVLRRYIRPGEMFRENASASVGL
jgi:hypothetical protein